MLIIFIIVPLATFAALDVNKSFAPANIYPREISKLTIKLQNSSLIPTINTKLTDYFPEDLFVASPSNIYNSCSGTIETLNTLTGGVVNLSGGIVSAGDGTNPGTCNIILDVYSPKKGTYINTIDVGDVTGTVGGNPVQNEQSTQGTLVTMLQNITGTKTMVFSGTNTTTSYIQGYEFGTVKISLKNPNPISLNNLSFLDDLNNYSRGLHAIPGTGKSTCSGSFSIVDYTNSYGVSSKISFSGGIIPPFSGVIPGECTISFDVEPSKNPKDPYNSYSSTNRLPIGNVTTEEGAINYQDISYTMGGAQGINISKNFIPNVIDINDIDTTTLNINFYNYNAKPIENFYIKDVLPKSLNGIMAYDSLISNTCSGTLSSSSGGTILELSGATLKAANLNAPGFQNGSCTLSVKVKVNDVGTYTNIVPAGDLNTYEYNQFSSTLTVNSNIVGIDKKFSRQYIYQGDKTNIIFTFTNRSKATDVINLKLKDDLSTMGIDNGVPGDTDPFFKIADSYVTTCPSVEANAPVGTSIININNLTIPKNSSCTFTIPIKSDTDTYPINQWKYNTIPVGNITYENTASSGSTVFPFELKNQVYVYPAISLYKEFIPNTVGPLGETRLRIRIRRSSYDYIPLKNINLLDSLPFGHTISSNPDIKNDCGGEIIGNPGTSSISLSGGTLSSLSNSAECNIYINVRVPALTSGQTIQKSTNTITGSTHGKNIYFSAKDYNGGQFENYSNVNADITRKAVSITANKEFIPPVINGGGVSRVRITLENTLSEAINLSGVGITDELPTDIKIHTNPNPNFTDQYKSVTGKCRGGTFSGSIGSNKMILSDAFMDAGGICHFEFNVTSYKGGNHINTLSSGDVVTKEGITNSNDSAATLTVARNLNIGKGFSPNIIEKGKNTTLIIEIFNTQVIQNDETGASPAIIDTLPAGLSIVGTPTTTCSGGIVTKGINPDGTSYLRLDGGLFKAESACQIYASITGTGAGLYTNTIAAGDLKSILDTKNPDSVKADLKIIEPIKIQKTFSPTTISYNDVSTIRINLTNPNNSTILPAGITGVKFKDTLSGMVLSSPINFNSTCQNFDYQGVQGGNQFEIKNATIPPNSSCYVDIRVTSNIVGIHPNQTNEVYTNENGTGAKSNIANLTVTPPKPASIIKSISPNIILRGTNSKITLKINNPNSYLTLSGGLTGVKFKDVLSGMILSTPLNISSSNCGMNFSYNASPGGNIFEITNATISPSSDCYIYFEVTSNVIGTHPNQTTEIFSNELGTGAKSNIVNLDIVDLKEPSFEKLFDPLYIIKGEKSKLTFRLYNSNLSSFLPGGLTGIGFSDTFSGMTLTNPLNITFSGCGDNVSYEAIAGGSFFSVSGVTISPKEYCLINMDVVGNVVGTLINRASEIVTNETGTGSRSNTGYLYVTEAQKPTINKSFTKSNIGMSGTTTINIQIYNPNSSSTLPGGLTGIKFSDTLSGMILTNPLNITSSCNDFTYEAEAGGNKIDITNATVSPTTSCLVSFDVIGIQYGTYPNQTTEIYSNESGTGAKSNIVNLNILKSSNATVSKWFSPNLTGTGKVSQITFQIHNPNSLSILPGGLTGIKFSDTLSGMTLTDPLNITSTCNDFTYEAEAGGDIFEVTNANLLGTAGGGNNCYVYVDVKSGNNVGTFPNQTSEIITNEIGTGAKSNIANLEISKPVNAKINKYFSPGYIGKGQSSTILFEINNPNNNQIMPGDLTGIKFNDTFSGITLTDPLSITSNCNDFTYEAEAGGDTFKVTNLSISPGSFCQIYVEITGNTIGTLNNQTSEIISHELGTGAKSNIANLQVVNPIPPRIEKSFSPKFIGTGGISTITFSIFNKNSTQILPGGFTGIKFSDTLSGMTLTDPLNITSTCNDFTYEAEASGDTFKVTNASLESTSWGQQCYIYVDVTSNKIGTHINQTTEIYSNETQTGQKSNLANLVVTGPIPPILVKTFQPNEILVGKESYISFSVSNMNNASTYSGDLTGIRFSDFLTGMILSDPLDIQSDCNDFTYEAEVGGDTFELTNLSLPLYASCNISVKIKSIATNLGIYPNQTTEIYSNETGTGKKSNKDNLIIVKPRDISIEKNYYQMNFPEGGGKTTMTFYIQNPNLDYILPGGFTGIKFSDYLSGITIATPSNIVNNCNGIVNAEAGGNIIEVSNMSLLPGAGCSIRIDIITSVESGVYPNQTTEVYSNELGTGAKSNVAYLQVGNTPPNIQKMFIDQQISKGSVSNLLFLVANMTDNDFTNASFYDELNNMQISSGAEVQCNIQDNISSSYPPCDSGSYKYTISGDRKRIDISNFNLKANESKMFIIKVTSDILGEHPNVTSGVKVQEISYAGAPSSEVSLFVQEINPLSIKKYFDKKVVYPGEKTRLNFEIKNPNSQEVTLQNQGFTIYAPFYDIFPSIPGQMVLAGDPNENMTTNCLGSPEFFEYPENNLIISTPAGSGSKSVIVSGLVIPAEDSCTLSIDVVAYNEGLYHNKASKIFASGLGYSYSGAGDSLLVLSPKIGIAKRLVDLIKNGDGTYNVEYELKVKNSGIGLLTNIQIEDDLARAFSGAKIENVKTKIISGNINLNSNYNGKEDIKILTGNDKLNEFEEAIARISLRVIPISSVGPFFNSSKAMGIVPNTNEVKTDLSQDGSDVDPDKDYNPGNNSEPTRVGFTSNAVLGISKMLLSPKVDKNKEGIFDIKYELKGKNMGDINLENVQIEENLQASFIGADILGTKLSIAGGTGVINSYFNGLTNKKIFTGSGVNLPVGQEIKVLLDLKLGLNTKSGTYDNIAKISGLNKVTNEELIDYSQDGASPDPDGDLNPYNNTAPTKVSLSVLESPISTGGINTGTTNPGITTPHIGGGSSSVDNCPYGDNSGNLHDGICEIKKPESQESDTGSIVKEEDSKVEDNLPAILSPKEISGNNNNTQDNDSVIEKDISIIQKIEKIKLIDDFTSYLGVIPKTGIIPLSLFKKYNGESLISGTDGNNPYYESLIGLYRYGVIGGGGLEKVEPKRNLKRLELSKMILIGTESEIEERNIYYMPYNDVTTGTWYEKYIYNAIKQGIMTGETENSFNPEGTVTYKVLSDTIVSGFNLGEAGNENDSVEILKTKNLLPYSFNQNSNINKQITREEASGFIYRALIMKKAGEEEYKDSIKLDIDKLDIHVSPSRTLLEHPSVWLKDLEESGAGFYEDTLRGRTIILGHSSIWPEDKNPYGAVFKKLIGGSLAKGDEINITRNGQKLSHKIKDVVKVKEEDIDKLKEDVPLGTKIIIFTCDKDLRYRWVYYAE